MTNPTHSFPPDALNQLREDYCLTIPEKIKTLQRLIDEMRLNMLEETLQSLRLHVHKIAGSSGTYGFPEVSDTCKRFEKEILKTIEEFKTSKANPEWISCFIRFLDEVKEGFSHAKDK